MESVFALTDGEVKTHIDFGLQLHPESLVVFTISKIGFVVVREVI